MKLAFVINSLSAGGAERILTLLANQFCAAGETVSILTFTDEPPFYQLDSRIELKCLGRSTKGKSGWAKLLGVWKLVFSLRAEIERLRPDRLISFMDQANILTLLAAKHTPVIVSERIYPASSSILEGRSGIVAWGLKVLRNCIYRRATKIVVLTEDAKEYFPSALRSKISVIPNPVMLPVEEVPDKTPPPLSIVSMGRLTRQKRFDLLIDAFSHLAKQFPEWSLTIFGEGPLSENLQSQIDQLGLGNRVRLPGLTRTPWAVLKQAEIFVLCSDYEGFPGALAQAMSVGVAVIATDCKSGPSELVQHEVNGLLIPASDLNVLSESLRRLLSDASLRSKLGENGKGVCQKFTLDTFLQSWRALLLDR